MLNEKLLRAYCEGFFGYGNPRGKYWFIGPEEAGGHSEAEVQERVELWKQHPEPRQIIDGFEFDAKRKHSQHPFHKTQATWDRLIRVQLAAEGQAVTDNEIASFKLENWARKPTRDPSAQNCLLELLPLACPRMRSWPHDAWTDPQGDFKSRKCYKKRFIEHRISKLEQLVNEYKQPKCVVFYSMDKKRQTRWETVIGHERCPWENCECGAFDAKFLCRRHTLFAVIHHPNSRGITHGYFQWVGEQIEERLRRCSVS